jgi:hypothetical protein
VGNSTHSDHRETSERSPHLEKKPGSHLVSRELRRELRDWLETYQQLRRREANLIHEAFVLDVGEGE